MARSIRFGPRGGTGGCAWRAIGSGFQASAGCERLVSVAAAAIGSSSGGSSQTNSGAAAGASSRMVSGETSGSRVSGALTPDASSSASRCSTACSATCACSSKRCCSTACESMRAMRRAWPIPNPNNAPSSASLNDSSSIQPSTSPISMNIHCMVDIPKRPHHEASPSGTVSDQSSAKTPQPPVGASLLAMRP
ncbi:hypothetical protein D3C85_572660 [compost metagenome]